MPENLFSKEALDLAKELQESGFDMEEFRALAREMKQFKNAMDSGDDNAKKEIVRNKPEFKLMVEAWPDFVISKKTGRSEKYLIWMPSCESFTIKTINGGKEKIENIDGSKYSTFTKDLESNIKLSDQFWIKEIKPGKAFFDDRLKPMTHPIICDMLRRKILLSEEERPALYPPGNVNRYTYSRGRAGYEYFETEYDKHKLLYEKMASVGLHYTFDRHGLFVGMAIIEERFGHDNAVDFAREMRQSLIAPEKIISSMYSYSFTHENLINLFDRFQFEYSSLKNYMLYESARQGHALSVSSFLRTWADTLDMQMLIYGRVKEKYPKQLMLLHDQLSYKCTLMKEELDEKKFANQVERASKLETRVGDFKFISPRTKQDFYDEATSQANCLASYISRFTNGDCLIMFMRKAESPDESYITMEIRGGQVVQAKREQNRNPSREEWDVIRAFETKIQQKMAS